MKRTKRDTFLTPYQQVQGRIVLRRNPVPIAPILEKVDEDFTDKYEPASQRTTTEKVVKEVLVPNPVKTSSKTFINPQHLNPEEATFLTETEEILSKLAKDPSKSSVEIKQLMDEIDSKVEVILAKKVDEIDGSEVQVNLAPRENDEIEQHKKHLAEVIFKEFIGNVLQKIDCFLSPISSCLLLTSSSFATEKTIIFICLLLGS